MLGKIIATIKLSGRKHIGDNTNKEKIKLHGIKHVGDNTKMKKITHQIR
jgi:hypothetical protein